MEMTFPHSVACQHSVNGRVDHRTLLAAARARQVSSQTVRLLRRAETTNRNPAEDAAERLHYFAHTNCPKTAARGAFWRDSGLEQKLESAVNQAGSTNIKDQGTKYDPTGEQLNLAGHGASRTL
ncbi:MAG: hypothetical protein WBO17_06520 [Sphingorhabdus sp.]